MSALTIDYVIVLLISSLLVIWIIYRVSQNQSDQNLDNSDDSDNDGGIPFDLTPPVLDLPPGVLLPQGDPQNHLILEKEELLA